MGTRRSAQWPNRAGPDRAVIAAGATGRRYRSGTPGGPTLRVR